MGDEPLGDARVPVAFYVYVLPALGVAVLGAVWPSRWRRKVFIPALLAAYFATGAWMLRLSPSPYIDVFELTRDSSQAVWRGQNPYAIDFPVLYTAHPDWVAALYPPGTVRGGRVHFGYQYMPLSLEFACAGHLLGGDFRLGNLAALTVCAGLLAYAGGGLAAAAASLLLLTPRGFYVIEQGWSEPVVAMCMALVVFCAARRPRWLAWSAGLLMASKQYMILGVPALLLLLPRPLAWKTTGAFLIRAAAAGLAVTAPMVLWNVHAFWHSAVVELLQNPYRYDSFNFMAIWAGPRHAEPPGWIVYAVAGCATLLAVWSAPRTAGGFCAALAVILLSFFAVAKQAFNNYYFLAIAALCCAVAGAFHDDRHPSQT
jgi:hypothetical protein